MIHKFDPVIYPRKVWVSIGKNDLSEFGNVEPVGDDAAASVQQVLNVKHNLYGILIQFKSKALMTPKFIAHEASHAAMEVFKECGCFVDTENQEPFAYLIGAIVEFCYKCKNERL